MSVRITKTAAAALIGVLLIGGVMAGHAWLGSETDETAVAASGEAALLDRGATVFRQCAACHSIGRNGPDLDGPNLYGVVDGPVARRRGRFAYTAALRAVGGIWDRARLNAWLTDPQRFAPGTSMPFAGLADADDRAAVIAYLTSKGPQATQP
ncbi:c-type cytochrome [Lichenihabitans sp. PAMC28606]|uniref:c-type cytochrome n=1 Tax=Lichenihabitans sp. PAMC28606 TaxID=2880932 RepID=UPI001D09EADA|nr:c-type cytochrome [Lichenihabitans sp. PAMC28606]UDL96220.1 c-type cytochrome [Lichenihabitans sp. PAMC28606]